jgi:mannan endo-1,4-beta-mannosidase
MASFTATRRRGRDFPSTRALFVLFCSFGLLFSLIPSALASVLIGVFDPGQGRTMNQPLAMDRWQGKPNAIQTIFVTFDDSEMNWLWPALEGIWDGHKIPLITWEPKYWAQASPNDIELKIVRGELDVYLKAWGKGLKNFIAGPDRIVGTTDDRRAYLRFAHEMNGNWYPWSATTGQSTPADYVRMWRYVFNLFDSDVVGLLRSKTEDSLLWVWSPIDFDVGDFKMDQYYPGDEYVDWKGLTGFNWGTSEVWSGWWDPSNLFSESIDRIRKIGGNKPVGITEYSSVPNGGDKGKWIDQFFDLVLAKDIKMALYFNIDKNEQSGTKYWSIFGYGGDDTFTDSPSKTNWKGWSAYKDAIAKSSCIGADLDNPRVLTDKLFKGGVASSIPPSSVPAPRRSSSPAPSNDDGSEDDESDSGSENPTPVPSSVPLTKILTVFKDSTSGTYDVLSWGSEDTIANPKFQLPATSALADDLVEGKKVLKVHSTGWGGGGFFLTAKQGTVSLSDFRRLKFEIATTSRIRIEIEDVSGKKWTRFIKGTSSLVWRTVVLSTRVKSATGTKIDFERVKGLFLATSSDETDFYIDNVRFEK